MLASDGLQLREELVLVEVPRVTKAAVSLVGAIVAVSTTPAAAAPSKDFRQSLPSCERCRDLGSRQEGGA